MPLLVNGQVGGEKHGAFTLQQLQQLYHQQLLQQINEADTARNELTRVRNQLKIEIDARTQAQNQVHRLLAQNREMIVMIQRLMSQVSEKHAKDFLEPLNETWMLSELSQTATVLSSSNLFQDTSTGVHSSNIDFSSQVFDNSNIGSSPRRTVSSSTPNKATFDDLIGRTYTSPAHTNQVSDYTVNTQPNSIVSFNNSNNVMNRKDTNPFGAPPPTNDAYKIAFNNTVNTTQHSPGITQNSLNSTDISSNSDVKNNNLDVLSKS